MVDKRTGSPRQGLAGGAANNIGQIGGKTGGWFIAGGIVVLFMGIVLPEFLFSGNLQVLQVLTVSTSHTCPAARNRFSKCRAVSVPGVGNRAHCLKRRLSFLGLATI